jgi:hypothetical protein
LPPLPAGDAAAPSAGAGTPRAAVPPKLPSAASTQPAGSDAAKKSSKTLNLDPTLLQRVLNPGAGR